MILLRLALLLVALIGAPVASAVAGELRVLDYTNAGSTSRCIGNPVTPLCAVETLEACRIRGEWKYCERVGYDYSVFEGRVPDAYSRLWYSRYELIAQRILLEKDISLQAGRPGGKKWKPGDIALLVRWQGCPPDDECVKRTRRDPTRSYGEGCRGFERCGWGVNPRTYILRQRGDRWYLIAAYFDPVLPESFWKRK